MSIPNSIQERLSKKLLNEEIFNTAKCEYDEALKKCGFKIDFKYIKIRQKSKNRSRNIILWFKPLFKKQYPQMVNIYFFDSSIDIFHVS